MSTTFLKLIITTYMFLAIMPALFEGAAHAADPRPNILFIISDDLNNDLGTYNNDIMVTPHLDKLAKEGLQFNRAYCQFTLCNPSRSSMLSGLYPIQTEIYGNGTPIRKRFKNIVTMPQLFKNNGYSTARVGKIYHYGVPSQIGTNGLDDPESWDYVHNPKGIDKTKEKEIITLIPEKYGATLSWLSMDGDDKLQTDGLGATETIRLLEQFAQDDTDKPFFLAFGLYRPHTPYVAPHKYFDLYPTDSITVPPIQHPRVPAAAFHRARAEQDNMTNLQGKQAIQAYRASISFMDAKVGRVLDSLDKLGLRDNTIVVFTSDHGYHMGEHGLWQKRSLFEQSARVPLILSTPNQRKRGIQTNSPSELVDLYPTLASLCGLTAPDHAVGIDLSPLLDNPDQSLKPFALTEESVNLNNHKFKGYAIRSDRYRYVEWDEGKKGIQLFDHKNDPEEMKNLAGKPEVKELQATLHKQLTEKLAALKAKNLDEWK